MDHISFSAFLSGRSGRTAIWALVILSIYFVLPVIPGAERQNARFELTLLDAGKSEPQTAADLKRDGFRAAVLVLDESTPAEKLANAMRSISEAKLNLYYWIEVGRNVEMAQAHPEWMGSIGMHDDWRKRFQ